MITLITGAPGNGKTCYVVSQLWKEGKDRPLFCWGIDGLKIDHQQLPELDEWTVAKPLKEDPSVIEHEFALPAGSLVCIDEAQKVFRARSAASKVPPYVQAFERHRHHGLDFYLLSQSPHLIDANVRALVGRHIHLYSTWKGRTLVEWSGCKNPTAKTDIGEGARRSFKLPSDVFELYDSAEIHTKIKRRAPKELYVSIGALLGLVLGGFYLAGRFNEITGGEQQAGAGDGDRGTRASVTATAKREPAPVRRVEQAVEKLEPEPEKWFIRDRQYVAVGDRILRNSYVLVSESGVVKRVDGRGCRLLGYSGVCNDHEIAGLEAVRRPLAGSSDRYLAER